MPSLSEQLRAVIKTADVSIYRLAMDTRIKEEAIRGFMSGRSGLSLKALERLCDHFALVLTPSSNAQQQQ